MVFKEELSEAQVTTLETNLTPYDLDLFLEVLYEFIVTYVMIECKPHQAEEE